MTDLSPPLQPLAARGADPLTGRFTPPGDKAISHLALIVGALAVGRTTIEGLLEADDVRATAAALRQLGVRIESQDTFCSLYGLGVGGLLEPAAPLDLGNSGTGARLLTGLLATYAFSCEITGGPTLQRRPMGPLLDALAPIGVTVATNAERRLPLILTGPEIPLPVSQTLPLAAEQIKSALLLAGLHISGTTTIVEPMASRDHVERLLADFGARIQTDLDAPEGVTISLTGLPELRPRHVSIPGDPSAAAYAIVAALIVRGSDMIIDNLLVNPLRTGLIDTLLEMGGDIQFLNQRESGGEHVADLRVRSSHMKAVRVDAHQAAAMLDDIPALAVAAAYAQGETLIEGLAELRVQECDRLAAIAAGLAANKVVVTEGETSLTIGGIGRVDGGGMVACRSDHRIAMSFLTLGLASRHSVTVDDTNCIAASFPRFVTAMSELGARFEPAKGR